jgi:predicted transcriptional regulator
MIEVPTARECMTTWFVTVHPDMDVYKAIDVLSSKRASASPVLDDDGALVGILTEKDCLRVLSRHTYGELEVGRVSDFMSKVTVWVTTDMDLFTVAKKFLASNFTILPVMEQDQLVGRISRQDMLQGILQLQQEVEETKRTEERKLEQMQRPASIQDFQVLAGNQKPEHLAALLSQRHAE